MDFWISKWISGFQIGFLDFNWISGFQIGFLPTVYEISFVTDPSSPADHTLPHLPEVYQMPITDTSVLWTRSAAVVLATVLANEIFLLKTTFECLFSY